MGGWKRRCIILIRLSRGGRKGEKEECNNIFNVAMKEDDMSRRSPRNRDCNVQRCGWKINKIICKKTFKALKAFL